MDAKLEAQTETAKLPVDGAFRSTAQAVEAARAANFLELATLLGVPLLGTESESAHRAFSTLMAHVLKMNGDGAQTELLDAVADAFIASVNNTTFSDWVWALHRNFCRRDFELSGVQVSPDLPLLTVYHNRPVAAKLIESMVAQATEPKNADRTYACAPVIRMIRTFNIEAADPAALDQPFVFAPNALRKRAFLKLLTGDPYHQPDLIFCESDTPAEYFRRVPKGVILGQEAQKEITILCVSRHGIGRARNEGDYESSWHNLVKGIDRAVIRVGSSEELQKARVTEVGGRYFFTPYPASENPERLKATAMVVEIAGKIYPVVYERTGLSGSSKGVAIWNQDDPEMPVWDLYTNIPVRDGQPISSVPDSDSGDVVRFKALGEYTSPLESLLRGVTITPWEDDRDEGQG